MRISIDHDDQGFLPPTLRNYAVTLNGKPVCGAITVDEELGLIHLVRDHSGRPDILRGTVKLEFVH